MSLFAVQVQGRDDMDRSGDWFTLATYPRCEEGSFTEETLWTGNSDNAAFAAFKARQFYRRPVRVIDLSAVCAQ